MMFHIAFLIGILSLCVSGEISKPSVGLTEEEIEVIVKLHNDARREEESSDMYELEWDEHLASTAWRWAKECNFTHGFKDNDYGDELGQNLYIKEGQTNKFGAVKTWLAEKKFYDYDAIHCDKTPCGHYTQAVWAKSYKVGCAFHKCARLWWPDQNEYFNDINNIVCHYWPGGNLVQTQPFKKGERCSQCVNGKGWCSNGMCKPFCRKKGMNCDCPGLDCDHCGETDPDTCTCSCTRGFSGKWCKNVCRNKDPKCDRFEPVHCRHRNHGKTITKLCPLLCGICHYEDDKEWTCAGQTWNQVFGIVDANPTRDRRGCLFPFVYNQTYHDECVQHVTGIRVCSLTYSLDKYKSHYKPCTEVKTHGGNSNGAQCHFPFIYEGAKWYDCLPIGGVDDISWCGTTRDYDTESIWGECELETPEAEQKGGKGKDRGGKKEKDKNRGGEKGEDKDRGRKNGKEKERVKK